MEEIVNNIASSNTGEMPLVFKNLFEKYVDENTKTLINKFSNTDDLNERINIMKDYTNKNIPKDKEEADLDDVIRQKHDLENQAKHPKVETLNSTAEKDFDITSFMKTLAEQFVKSDPSDYQKKQEENKESTKQNFDLGKFFKLFGADNDSTEFIDKMQKCEDPVQQLRLFVNYHNRQNSEYNKEETKPEVKIFNLTELVEKESEKLTENFSTQKPESLDDLIRTKNTLDKKISSLHPKEQKEYYAKLYQIPTDKDLHIKLDVILQKLEDLSQEVSVIRKHI